VKLEVQHAHGHHVVLFLTDESGRVIDHTVIHGGAGAQVLALMRRLDHRDRAQTTPLMDEPRTLPREA
jgi:hypothetical protein